jgi:hypothetical protein
MIASSQVFDQQTLTQMIEHDPLVQRSRAFFELFDWNVVPEPALDPSQPGKRPHPPCAYRKRAAAQAGGRLCHLYPLPPFPARASLAGCVARNMKKRD